jgi:hypothetical protein
MCPPKVGELPLGFDFLNHNLSYEDRLLFCLKDGATVLFKLNDTVQYRAGKFIVSNGGPSCQLLL